MKNFILVASFVGATVFGEVIPFKEIPAKIKRLAPVKLSADVSKLSAQDKQAMQKVIAAAKYLDPLYLQQVWAGNPPLKNKLQADKSAKGPVLLHFFRQNVGPWSRLDHGQAFINDVPAHKPPGAGFYPEDMTKQEFETWVATLSPQDKEAAVGFFTKIVRGTDGELKMVPYSEAYADFLVPAAKLLKEAANLTPNTTLKTFLNARAEAFSSNDYYASDVAWMGIDAPLDITFGPYETYEDEIFSYKAAFEAYVCVRNEKESQKLSKFGGLLQELENNLPMDPKFRNPKIGAGAAIRVVDLVFSSGDGRRGVMTAAFNLPNDERIVKAQGSKRVMLKNVQEAKFQKVLVPISKIVLSPKDQKKVAFEPFFTHILMHELVHGLGPGEITVNGTKTTVRHQLKDTYSALEEAKADITGLWAMQYLMNKGQIDKGMQESMYTTYLASAFRSVRFGIDEAHGKGVALQFNFLKEEGAIAVDKGIFRIVPEKIQAAVAKLSGMILTLQAEGNYEGTKALMAKYAVLGPEMKKALEQLASVPTDIEPKFTLAGE